MSGWNLEGEWEVGAPQGLGGSDGFPDPTAAYNNQRVLGTDLTGLGSMPGDYEHGVVEAATTRTPKRRYVKGYGARPALFIRKWFGDGAYEFVISRMAR